MLGAVQVYLVQHGVAVSEEEDPARPLSPAGRDEVERVARAAAARGVRPAEIVHSGKARAAETAEILALHLKPSGGVRAVEGLDPGDKPRRARKRIEKADEPVMLVGHLPHLDRLASLLLTGSDEGGIVAFRKGGIVCLERSEDGESFAVAWALTPELVAP
jgi:phosphohistidine phosphatase